MRAKEVAYQQCCFSGPCVHERKSVRAAVTGKEGTVRRFGEESDTGEVVFEP
jgi:hypothetical protein